MQRLYGQCIQLASNLGTNDEGIKLLLHSLPQVNLCTLKALALLLLELSESSSITLMGLDNFAVVFAPCWLRNPSDNPEILLQNASKEIAFAKEALAVLCAEDFVVQQERQTLCSVALPELWALKHTKDTPFSKTSDERAITSKPNPSKPREERVYTRRQVPQSVRKAIVDIPKEGTPILGVALEEQCLCEWSGLRIPAVLGGMLMALSTPVDVIIEALSSADACDCDTAAVAFAELESLCTGHAGDADTVCGAIVSKRSVHGAGLDIGLLRLWLRKLPVAVSCGCARFSLFVDCVCVCGRMAPRFV